MFYDGCFQDTEHATTFSVTMGKNMRRCKIRGGKSSWTDSDQNAVSSLGCTRYLQWRGRASLTFFSGTSIQHPLCPPLDRSPLRKPLKLALTLGVLARATRKCVGYFLICVHRHLTPSTGTWSVSSTYRPGKASCSGPTSGSSGGNSPVGPRRASLNTTNVLLAWALPQQARLCLF